MKRFLPFILGLLIFLPLHASAAFGTIVPEVCQSCACGFGGVLAIIQNLSNLIIALAMLIATLIMVWAGVMYIMSATNPESRSTANKMLLNAVMGIVIVLSAWLIVDFVMKTLYGGQFGPWNSILVNGTGEGCVVAKPSVPLFSGNIIATPGLETGGTGTGGGTGSNCPAADPSTVVAFPASATSGETEKATAQTVQNFLGMRAAALQDGIDLKVTDGYRSDAEQVSLWNRYQQGNGGVAAKPCSIPGGNGSNHNSGVAIDINVGCTNGNSSCNTAAYQWLKAHGSNWSFRNAIPSDPVHWSPSGH